MTAWFSSRLKAHLIARCLNLGDFLPLQALVRNSAVHILGISSNTGLIDSGSGAGKTVGREAGPLYDRGRLFTLIKTRYPQLQPKDKNHHPISSKYYYLLPVLHSRLPASMAATPSNIGPSHQLAMFRDFPGRFPLYNGSSRKSKKTGDTAVLPIIRRSYSR